MVFRRDSKVDAFQRQISALRHQLGGESDDYAPAEPERPSLQPVASSYRTDLPDLDFINAEPSFPEGRQRHDLDHVADPPPTQPAVPAIDTFTSVIAHTTSWTGNLESSGSLHVHGRVEGSLTARDDIFIAEEADVDAVVTAANVTVAGNVRGSIECKERFEVLPRGKVAGDVRAPVIVVHEGGMIAGEIAMTRGNESRPPVAASVGARAAHGGA